MTVSGTNLCVSCTSPHHVEAHRSLTALMTNTQRGMITCACPDSRALVSVVQQCRRKQHWSATGTTYIKQDAVHEESLSILLKKPQVIRLFSDLRAHHRLHV